MAMKTIFIEKNMEPIKAWDTIIDLASDKWTNFSIENDGIGKYEFWGQVGIDKGNDYAVADWHTVRAHMTDEQIQFLPSDNFDFTFEYLGHEGVVNVCVNEIHDYVYEFTFEAR